MAVAGAIAVGLGLTIAAAARIPLVVTLTVVAVLAAWFNSLQHEVIHGHPTPWRSVNTIIASVPVGLVFPFGEYRRTHLAHHAADVLTDPADDPESYYVSATEWEHSSRWRRRTTLALQTFGGRLVLGPPVYAVRFWRDFLGRSRTDATVRHEFVLHVVLASSLIFVVYCSPLPLAGYVLAASWGGASLSLVRSFAEHRAVDTGSPSATVHTNWFFALLFLNLNLHDAHHASPGVAWYRLPAAHRALGREPESERGAGVYSGYFVLFRRHLVRPLWDPVHPCTLQPS